MGIFSNDLIPISRKTFASIFKGNIETFFQDAAIYSRELIIRLLVADKHAPFNKSNLTVSSVLLTVYSRDY